MQGRPARPTSDGRDIERATEEDLFEACQRAVSRVLDELPARDRQVLEEHRAEVVEHTHRETRAALAEIHGVVGRVA